MTFRTRSQGSFSSGEWTYRLSTNSGASYSTSTYTSNSVQEGEVQTTTDVVTPNFASRIARGEIINNPFRTVIERRSNDLTSHEIRNTSGTYRAVWSKGYGMYSDLPDAFRDISNQQKEVSTEVAARVASTSVDGVTEVGEARETMRLFSLHDWNLKEHLRKEIRYAERKGYKFPRAIAPTNVLLSNWLKYRYGIMPFVRLLNDTLVVGSRIRTRRETARAGTATGSREVFTSPITYGSFHNSWFVRTCDWEASVRAGILYEYRDFGNKYGFSLSNVPAAIWELTPWSFVVDWFANTGDFIRALTPKLQVRQLATWLGYQQKLNFGYERFLGPIKPAGYSVYKPQSGTWQYQIETRRRVPMILSPSLYIRENALSEIATSQRIVDAFALTSQLFYKLMSRTR